MKIRLDHGLSPATDAIVRKSCGASRPRRRNGSGPSRSHAALRRGMVAAERTRNSVFGAGGISAAQAGGGWPARADISSTTPAARAHSVWSRSRGAGTSDHTKPARAASASHCLALSASKPRSACTRSLRSMLGFPEVVKSIPRRPGDLPRHPQSRGGRAARDPQGVPTARRRRRRGLHTHPSGDPTPSDADLLFTRRSAYAATLVGVEARGPSGARGHRLVGRPVIVAPPSGPPP